MTRPYAWLHAAHMAGCSADCKTPLASRPAWLRAAVINAALDALPPQYSARASEVDCDAYHAMYQAAWLAYVEALAAIREMRRLSDHRMKSCLP